MKISAYVPFHNCSSSVVAALQSLRSQTIPPDEIFALDDGSSDGGCELVQANGFHCLKLLTNNGRGAARHRAMLEATSELVLCCDATNVLPSDFVECLLRRFDDHQVAAVYGRIQDPNPTGVVARWRSRHLFKSGYKMHENLYAPLITYGTLVRRSAVLEAGNFDPNLRHSEDKELGDRLNALGYLTVFDPSVAVFCIAPNSIGQVLERYWRWHAGPEEAISLYSYFRSVIYSLKCMVRKDLIAGDPLSAFISLICPHFQFWITVWRRMFAFSSSKQ